MHTTNSWRLRDLFRWQSVSLALALLFQLSTQEASAQATGNYNFFDFQQKPYYFGITLGYNSSRFTPFNSDQFLQSDSIRVVESASGPGIKRIV